MHIADYLKRSISVSVLTRMRQYYHPRLWRASLLLTFQGIQIAMGHNKALPASGPDGIWEPTEAISELVGKIGLGFFHQERDAPPLSIVQMLLGNPSGSDGVQ
jgi:hypothetical protein